MTGSDRHAACPGWGCGAGFTDEQFIDWWLLRPRNRTPEHSEIELGYRLLRRFWRQGLASEGSREPIRHAFEDLNASLVYADTMAVNQVSRATMTSPGLRYARAFHQERDPSRLGAEHGDVEYSTTREQWLDRRPRAVGDLALGRWYAPWPHPFR